ncbi:MAG: hypothetical protein WCP85_14940 [Mariniphaga sp.]
MKGILLLIGICISQVLSAQNENNGTAKINSFTAAVTVQSKGISTIPNMTLGKPAIIFDMKIGRKLTFEPQFRFSLEGKPWAAVFWWRYYQTVSNKFKVTYHTNYSLAYKSVVSYTASGNTNSFTRSIAYLVGALEPNYKINNYLGVGLYLFYNRSLEIASTRNTLMLSFRPTLSNLPIAKILTFMAAPEIYSLNMDKNSGVFINSRFLISLKNSPFSISGLINKPLKSTIPSEYDFLWNVGLTYTFNKKYKELTPN